MSTEFPTCEQMDAASVVSSDLLRRAKTPKIGDIFRKGSQVATVTAVGDGKVWYDITTGSFEPDHCCEEIEDYVRLVDKTISNGATFEAA